MIRVPLHPDALRERADELERLARYLREIADGVWPEAVETSLIEEWGLGARSVEVLKGTRVTSGKHHLSSPLLVLDEVGGRALTTHRTYRLGARRGPQ